MENSKYVKKILEKKYKNSAKNLYSDNFFSDLFSGYSYTLGKKSNDMKSFLEISSDNDKFKSLLLNLNQYEFLDFLERNIEVALYNLAMYGTSYLYIEPEYEENESGKIYKELINLKIREIKGIYIKNNFYSTSFSGELIKLNLDQNKLISFDLLDLGYTRNYFRNLVNKIGKCDMISTSLKMTRDEENVYDFNYHYEKNQKKLYKYVNKIGWEFGTDGLSDSYILYNRIKLLSFKRKFFNYALERINKFLIENYIHDNSFKIVANVKNENYEEIWDKYQRGEFVISDLNKIL